MTPGLAMWHEALSFDHSNSHSPPPTPPNRTSRLRTSALGRLPSQVRSTRPLLGYRAGLIIIPPANVLHHAAHLFLLHPPHGKSKRAPHRYIASLPASGPLLCPPRPLFLGPFACPPSPGRHWGINQANPSPRCMFPRLHGPYLCIFLSLFTFTSPLIPISFLFPPPILPLPSPPTATLPPAHPAILLLSPLPAPPQHRPFHPSSRLWSRLFPPTQHAQHRPPSSYPRQPYPYPCPGRHYLRADRAPRPHLASSPPLAIHGRPMEVLLGHHRKRQIRQDLRSGLGDIFRTMDELVPDVFNRPPSSNDFRDCLFVLLDFSPGTGGV